MNKNIEILTKELLILELKVSTRRIDEMTNLLKRILAVFKDQKETFETSWGYSYPYEYIIKEVEFLIQLYDKETKD